MSEYIYGSIGDPLANALGEIYLPRAEVVRCRDCMYMTNQKYKNNLEYQTCGYFDSKYAEVEPDGYCAWSCRRSDKE